MKRFNVDVVVFDLDGTLIDSKEDIANSLNHTFNEVGYDPVPLKVIEGYVGNGIVPLIRKAAESEGRPEKEEEIKTLFRERYWAHLLDKTRLYPGVEETLDKLEGKYMMGLVSNKPERFTKKIVEGLGLSPYFMGAVYGGDTLKVKKPDPSALYEIAKKYGAPPSRILMVGDSAVDIKTGRNAGAHAIGVTYGFRSVKELEEAGADMLIDRFHELLEIL